MKLLLFIQENINHVLFLIYQHLIIFLFSMVLAILLAIFISLVITKKENSKAGAFILTITGAAQSVPPLAIIACTFIFTGIGPMTSIIALVVYSLVPIVFNTTSALVSVDPNVIEAARGMGFKKHEILWKIKFPLSIPVIMAGIRSAATINIGTATIASFIGGGGLGDLIFMGIKLFRFDMILTGAIVVALLAISVDTLLMTIEAKLKKGTLPG